MAPFFTPPHKKPASTSTSIIGGGSSSNSNNNSNSSSSQQRNRTSSNINTSSSRPGVAPTSFRRDLIPPSAEKQANRNSRVDLDFESALAAHETFKLHEGRDLTSIGDDQDNPNFLSLTTSRSTQETHESTSTVGNAHEGPSPAPRRLRKPHHGTPTSSPGLRVMSPSPSSGYHRRSGDSRPSTSSNGPDSPTPVKREFPPRDGDNDFRDETKKRSMFRSAGTASTPDLATLKRKKESRLQPPLSPDDDPAYASTDVTPSAMSNWTANLGTRSRAVSKDSGKVSLLSFVVEKSLSNLESGTENSSCENRNLLIQSIFLQFFRHTKGSKLRPQLSKDPFERSI